MKDKGELSTINLRLIQNIKSIVLQSRKRLISSVNHELITTYWNIGKEIVENEQQNKVDQQSSRQIILLLSKQLSRELGKGFSRSNLFNMRKFYNSYPDVQTLSGQLSWSQDIYFRWF
jgi:hypothetical protein